MSSPELLIRDYTSADFEAICEVDRQCFSEAIAYTPEDMQLALLQRGAFAIIAESNATIAGFILAYQRKRQVGHVVTIDILPAFRRMGLGKRFMEVSEHRMKSRGAERIILEVSLENSSAIQFYQGLGYRTRRLLPYYYPDNTDALLMEKVLDQ
jgi:[ribosomal protein S18]-alanine N-acetyltransferase